MKGLHGKGLRMDTEGKSSTATKACGELRGHDYEDPGHYSAYTQALLLYRGTCFERASSNWPCLTTFRLHDAAYRKLPWVIHTGLFGAGCLSSYKGSRQAFLVEKLNLLGFD